MKGSRQWETYVTCVTFEPRWRLPGESLLLKVAVETMLFRRFTQRYAAFRSAIYPLYVLVKKGKCHGEPYERHSVVVVSTCVFGLVSKCSAAS